MIASYLIETEDWSPEAAWAEFGAKRPPGIYKAEYIQDLFVRYGDINDAPAAPERPDWRDEEELDHLNDDGDASHNGHESSKPINALVPIEFRLMHYLKFSLVPRPPPRRGQKIPTFMDGVPGVHAVDEPLLSRIRQRINQLCHFRGRGFPGAQPVSMDRDNLLLLKSQHYKVSWKADGTRYMMLIDGPNSIFFADRDHSIFRVEGMTFLNRKNEQEHMSGTLLDGEMVIDEDPVTMQNIPRYLVYDIITIRKDNQDMQVGNTDFNTRLLCIQNEIEGARNTYIRAGKINKDSEPFRIRMKKFWDVQCTRELLGPKFTKKELGHEPDGLIFQPVRDDNGHPHPYTCGRDYKILKWKPSSHNSVDFKLRIIRENRPGMVAKDEGYLFVGGQDRPYGYIKLNKVLRALNNKIIECKWDHDRNEWSFMRERTDKSFPNAFATAEGVWKSITQPVTEDILLSVVESIPRPQKRPNPHDMPPPSMPAPKMNKTF